MMRFLLFFATVALITGLLHVYLYRRLVGSVTRSPAQRRAGKWVIAGLWAVLFLAGPLSWLLRDSTLNRVTGTVAWTWMGVAFILASVLLLLELVHGGAWLAERLRRRAPAPAPSDPASPDRRLFLARTVAGSAVVASGGLTGFGVWRAYTAPEVTELAVKLPRLPKALDGVTIVQVTDIHVGPLIRRQFMDEMVRQCNALKPDLVAITGDLVDGDVPTLGPAVAALSNLKSRFGSYFITGNHEYYSGDLEWSAELERMGITVLRNRNVRVGDAGASFDLVGVDDWGSNGGEPQTRRYDLDAALAGRDPARASVLLAHQPKNFKVAAEKGVGLQLSGHTHGGQMFPGTIFIPLLWEHPAGHYTHGDGHLYVSRGTGFWGPPIRVGSPPEIVKVTLLAG